MNINQGVKNLGRQPFASKQVTGDDGCIECRCFLLLIIVCEYDAIICELLCKISWYTLHIMHSYHSWSYVAVF